MFWQRVITIFQRISTTFAVWPRNNATARARALRKAPEIVNMLQNERWSELRSQFSPLVRWILTEPLLQKGFQALQIGTGPIVHVGDPVVSTGWLTTVKVPIQFKRIKLAMMLQMSTSGNLLNLRFYPQQLLGFATPWSPPRYAQRSSFRETNLQLGTSDLKVGGTLTIPSSAGQHPCIVMLPGSGPCDQDSGVGAAKPFKDIAWGLAQRGVATIRFDKVTYAHGTKIRGKKKFTLTEEYVDDAMDAVRHSLGHPQILRNCIFVLGHSLGAYVAPHLATIDSRIAGCILMAAPAAPLYWSALRQLKYFASIDDPSGSASHPHIDDLQRRAEVADSPGLNLSTPSSELPFGIVPAYWLDTRNYTPIESCRYLRKPVLVLQGGRDYQVTVQDDFARWREGLKDISDVEMHLYEKLNHLFITGQGQPTPLEYDTPGNVEESVIRDISDWVLKRSFPYAKDMRFPSQV